MISNLENIDYEEELGLAFSEYTRFFGVQADVPFKIVITPNLLDTFLQQSKSKQEQENWLSKSETINKLNGSVYFPACSDDEYVLIVHAARFNTTQIHYQTITHEYTHILDFFEYSRALGIQNLQREENFPNFECIRFYSEVRARFRSTLIYYSIVSLDREKTPSIFAALTNEYSKELSGNFKQDYYSLAQLYGQYLALVEYSCLEIPKPDWLHHYNSLWDFLDKNIHNISVFQRFDELIDLFYTV